MRKYFEIYPGTPIGKSSSVHGGKTNRLEKAEEQAALEPVPVELIASYVNDLLQSIGMKTVKTPKIKPHEIDYGKIQKDYGTKGKGDLVWMKFTKDGYLGVVASGNDVNFDIPLSASQYDEREWSYKRNEYAWKYTTSGILIHQLEKEWDTSFVLVFPLVDIPSGKRRGDIERAIGNYLISQGVPILDFYSHNYPVFTKIESDSDSKDVVNMQEVDEAFFDLYPNASNCELENEMECWDGID